MSVADSDQAARHLRAEEPSSLVGHAPIRARIAGLHCSLCTGAFEKALGRKEAVDQVAAGLAAIALIVASSGVLAVVVPASVWATVAIVASVALMLLNSLGGRPWLLFDAITSVGLPAAPEPESRRTAPATAAQQNE